MALKGLSSKKIEVDEADIINITIVTIIIIINNNIIIIMKVDETDRVSDRKGKKRRRESLFANAQWSSSGSRRRGSDVSEWPAWHHGWCR